MDAKPVAAKKKAKKKKKRPPEPEPAAPFESDAAVAALLERLGLSKHLALLEKHKFKLDSVQVSTAAGLERIGLLPAAAAKIVAAATEPPSGQAVLLDGLASAEAGSSAVMAAQPTGKKKTPKQNDQRSWAQLPAAPPEIVEPSSYLEPQPQPQPKLHEPEPELPASVQQLAALTAVPMAEWSEEQVLAWAELVEFDGETRSALRAAFNDEDTEGDELVALTAKPLQKMLKRAGLLGDLAATAEAVLAMRDTCCSAAVTKPGGVRVGSLWFDPQDPASRLGYGRFGEVFRGRHGEGGEACAVKRVAWLRFEREAG
jgi:hypothetical protein